MSMALVTKGNSENMEFIGLKVTSKVIQQTALSNAQEQIAVAQVPDHLKDVFAGLNKSNRQRIRIGSILELGVGDTHAIWGTHNEDSEDFKNLYSFLSGYPDKVFSFALELL